MGQGREGETLPPGHLFRLMNAIRACLRVHNLTQPDKQGGRWRQRMLEGPFTCVYNVNQGAIKTVMSMVEIMIGVNSISTQSIQEVNWNLNEEFQFTSLIDIIELNLSHLFEYYRTEWLRRVACVIPNSGQCTRCPTVNVFPTYLHSTGPTVIYSIEHFATYRLDVSTWIQTWVIGDGSTYFDLNVVLLIHSCHFIAWNLTGKDTVSHCSSSTQLPPHQGNRVTN